MRALGEVKHLGGGGGEADGWKEQRGLDWGRT